MGRTSKGPRLWLRPDRYDREGRLTHTATWFILDGRKQIGTGCCAGQRADAENELLKYNEGRQDVRIRYVYFITTEHPGFPIKIGITDSHRVRVTALQVALPYRIKVLAVAPTDDPIFERRLHRRFDHIKLVGEWFEQTPELLAFIEAMVADRKAA